MSITYTNIQTPRTMSFFCNTRGVGYTFFERGARHHISEMITARKRDNDRYFKRIEKLMTLCEPEVIVLEEYRVSKGGIKKGRVRDLIKRIEALAYRHNIPCILYTRREVRDVFSQYNVSEKYDIAQLLCIWIPWLNRWMYKPRTGEQMEPYSSAIFDAVSFAVTYFYLREV